MNTLAAADFNGPAGPSAMLFPAAHIWPDRILWLVVAGLVALAVVECSRRRSPLGLLMLLGGAIALFNEPVDDILGLVWHPRPGQNTVLNTIGPVPMWGLPTYIIFFGGVPWLLLRELQKLQFSLRAFWIGIAITFVLDLVIELPLLAIDLYTYYPLGDVPMSVFGLPLYWLMINTTGPILCAAILFAAGDYFKGWRGPLVVLLPMVTDSACSIAVGLPVYSSLRAPAASEALRWSGAALSCLIGLVLLDAFSKFMLAHTRESRRGALATQPLHPARAATASTSAAYTIEPSNPGSRSD